MMVIIGAIIVIGVIYLLLKRHESRMVLIAAGILMAVIAGKPMAALDAFAKSMTNAGLITSVCSCMGFAMVMKYTGCDKHLVVAIGKVLKKMGFMLIPGATIATFIINIAIPSAAGCSAAVGVIFIPILMSAGIHPAMAAAAVKSGTYGSMLNPGLVHNGVIAKLSNVEITEVITHHMMADIVGVIIAATTLTILAIFLKENKGYLPEGGNDAVAEDLKINPLYALMPLLPVIILLVGSTGMAPILKMGVPQAMLIGALLSLAVTRSNPTKLTKSFFDGMGDAYANIIGIIISVGVFVSGMQSLGLVKALINWMLESTGIVKIAATFGPFILAMISGSGDAATVAFNEAVTLLRMRHSLDCRLLIWVPWLLWVEPWDGQCLRLQVRPLSAPVLPVSIRWKFANVMLWVLLWPCWQAWSFCCSDFSKERPLLLRAFFYLFIYNNVFCKKSAFCSTMLNIFL